MAYIGRTYIIPIVVCTVFSFSTIVAYDYFTPVKIQITKHMSDSVDVSPSNLKSVDVSCNPDERIVGGGYSSSRPGMVKDIRVLMPADEPNVAIVDETAFLAANVYNENPEQTNYFSIEVYCAKITQNSFWSDFPWSDFPWFDLS
jgi:hypothetical protein